MIFAQWSPLRAAFGAYLFGAIVALRRSTSRASRPFSGVTNPFQPARSATFFLDMLPYLLVILVVVLGSRQATRKRVGRAGGARDAVRPRRARRLGAGATHGVVRR